MSSLGKLVIQITANTKGLEKAAGKVKSTLGSIGRAATSLPGLLGIAGGGAAVAGLVKMADEYTVMGTQLEYLTGSAEAADKAQEGLHQIAKKTGSTMSDLVGTYVKFNQAQEMTGLSAEENMKAIGAVVTTMIKTGTSGQQASAAVLQLGQALTSGTLAGDEFKSMSENASGLLNQLGEAMGIPRSELKKLASEGELTSKRVGQALLKIANDSEDMYEGLPETAARGLNSISLSFQKLWNDINTDTGIMSQIFEGLAKLDSWISQNSEQIKAWVNDGWGYLVTKSPQIIATFTNIGSALSGMLAIVFKAIDGWNKLIEAYKAWETLQEARKDADEQKNFSIAGDFQQGHSPTAIAKAHNMARADVLARQTVNIFTPVNKNTLQGMNVMDARQAAQI